MSKTLLDLFNEKVKEEKKDVKQKDDVGVSVVFEHDLDTAIYKPKKLNSKMNFGKFKTNTVKEVIDDNISYITFLLNSKTFDFRIDKEALEYYREVLKNGH